MGATSGQQFLICWSQPRARPRHDVITARAAPASAFEGATRPAAPFCIIHAKRCLTRFEGTLLRAYNVVQMVSATAAKKHGHQSIDRAYRVFHTHRWTACILTTCLLFVSRWCVPEAEYNT